MDLNYLKQRWRAVLLAALLFLAMPGCMGPLVRTLPTPEATPALIDIPRELDMVTFPDYAIGIGDILYVQAVRAVPQAPYEISEGDILTIAAVGVMLDQPIANQFLVQPNGTVDLGTAYGSVRIAGLSLDEADAAITRHLQRLLARYGLAPEVSISIARVVAVQQIEGEHLVTADGTVILGSYGTVYVAGLTLQEAARAIEEHLKEFLEAPKIGVWPVTLTSKVYYVISDTPGFGEQVASFPATGNETVLDAISMVQGLTRVSSREHIWIARPSPHGGCQQILPVEWNDIVRNGSTATNYQILPGDRLFIQGSQLAALDAWLVKATSPIERLFGVTLLSVQTIQTINRFPEGFGF